jgi:hypothetical protein
MTSANTGGIVRKDRRPERPTVVPPRPGTLEVSATGGFDEAQCNHSLLQRG